nr:MAG: capsid protein [Avian astrovirus 9]
MVVVEVPKPQRRRKNRRQRKDVKVELDIKTPNTPPQAPTPKTRRRPRRIQTKHVIESGHGQKLMEVTEASQKQLRNLQRRIRKINREVDGPKVQSVMSATLTLGPMYGNVSDDLSKQQRVWLNPCLLKPTDASNDTTPLTIRGSMYNLFKISMVKVILKPLVGNSNINGTLILVDLDNDPASAKPDTIDTIKARPHREAPVGSFIEWRIPARQLRGPRAGWWLTDTNEAPSMTLGPALNFSTYLKTYNLLGTKAGAGSSRDTTQYTGPIALAELEVRYQFSNLNPKPALASLIRKDAELEATDAKIIALNDGSIAMEVTDNAMSRSLNSVDGTAVQLAGKENVHTKSATVWTVGSEVVGTVSQFLGPWGWLLKGGWWLIRKILDPSAVALRDGSALDNKKSYYQVYASMEDAQKDIPVRSVTTREDQALPQGFYYWQQMNSDNLHYDVAGGRPKMCATDGGEETPDSINWQPSSQMKWDPAKPQPIYYYTDTNGIQPGLSGTIFDPKKIVPTQTIDAAYLVTGYGYWRFIKILPALQHRDYISIYTAETLDALSEQHSWMLGAQVGWPSNRTQYISYFELDSRALFIAGAKTNQNNGVLHTSYTLWKALKAVKEQKKTGTLGCPVSMIQWLHHWEASSPISNFLQENAAFGVTTAIMPMKLGTGAVAYPFKTATTSDTYVQNAKADTLCVINMDSGKIGLLFSVDWDPVLQYHDALPLVFASTVNVEERWQKEKAFWVAEDESYGKPSTSDTEIEVVGDTGSESETDETPKPRRREKVVGTRKNLQ